MLIALDWKQVERCFPNADEDMERDSEKMEKKTQVFYRICVKGHLDQLHWSNWLDGLTITHLENGETLLAGFLADQSALYGVLHKLESLRVTLLAVNCVSPDESPPISEGEEGIR